MTKVTKVDSDDLERLEKFDALVRSVRDAVTNPDIPVDVRHERDEHQSVFTVTVHNLAGLEAKLDREAKEQREREADIARAAARDARAKAKLEAAQASEEPATSVEAKQTPKQSSFVATTKGKPTKPDEQEILPPDSRDKKHS